MSLLDRLSETIDNSNQLVDVISKAEFSQCDVGSSAILEHQNCFSHQHGAPQTASCYRATLSLVLKCIVDNPSVVTEEVKSGLGDRLKADNIKVTKLVTLDILKLLSVGKGSHLIAMLKFTSLLTYLIKELLYEPKTLANEVLTLSKYELDPKKKVMCAEFLEPCAQACREVNNKGAVDDEVEEKWCEIIDWMGWFFSGKDDE